MEYPRTFLGGEEVSAAAIWKEKQPPYADVLIVCGQGVYDSGTYFGEFHDRDVYFEHALRFPEIAKRYSFNAVVLSGGFTQPRAPWLSEAESFRRILNDAGVSEPEGVPLILDECALDSAENLLFGLMTARLALGAIPIRRVGIWAAWRFKKWRFNRNAEALGIVEQTYVYGFAPASDTNIQVPPDDQRQRTLDEYKQDTAEASLLRAQDKEDKRQKRWQNNRIDRDRDATIKTMVAGKKDSWGRGVSDDRTAITTFDGQPCSYYKNRRAPFTEFAQVLDCLKCMQGGKSATEVNLEAAWQEIMTPTPSSKCRSYKASLSPVAAAAEQSGAADAPARRSLISAGSTGRAADRGVGPHCSIVRVTKGPFF